MVDITIYVEGKPGDNSSAATVDSSVTFRENFHQLFSQKLSPLTFNLKIELFGTVTQAKTMLQYIESKGNKDVLLIDLDAPKEKRKERVAYYEPLDTSKIFFMIQEMEAWILSQVDKIEEFGKKEGLERKKLDKKIADNRLLKIHPEKIDNPSGVLDTILRQYFDVVKIRQGKRQKIGKAYLKAKDGPKFIGLLELQTLMKDFDEVKRLIDYIVELS